MKDNLSFSNPDFFASNKNKDSARHSENIDNLLGLQSLKIEKQLLKANKNQMSNTWVGLHPQTLQTPYDEIYAFFMFLKEYNIESFVDLGAGYGRVAIVMNSFFPETSFIGYEIEESRVLEGRRVFELLKLENATLIEQNILDDEFDIPKADVYFIYDFSQSVVDLKKILNKLSNKISTDNFFLIARGKGVRSLIQEKFPEFWASFGVFHKENYSIYSSFVDMDKRMRALSSKSSLHFYNT